VIFKWQLSDYIGAALFMAVPLGIAVAIGARYLAWGFMCCWIGGGGEPWTIWLRLNGPKTSKSTERPSKSVLIVRANQSRSLWTVRETRTL
jgi:hypothetical protein